MPGLRLNQAGPLFHGCEYVKYGKNTLWHLVAFYGNYNIVRWEYNGQKWQVNDSRIIHIYEIPEIFRNYEFYPCKGINCFIHMNYIKRNVPHSRADYNIVKRLSNYRI